MASQKTRLLRVDGLFAQEIHRMVSDVNSYLAQSGEIKTVYPSDITRFIASNNILSITPERIIKKGNNGKKIIFTGELKL